MSDTVLIDKDTIVVKTYTNTSICGTYILLLIIISLADWNASLKRAGISSILSTAILQKMSQNEGSVKFVKG